MKPITLEEIDKKKKSIDNSLDQLTLEKKKVERAEKEMFDLHQQGLKPLRQILSERSLKNGLRDKERILRSEKISWMSNSMNSTTLERNY